MKPIFYLTLLCFISSFHFLTAQEQNTSLRAYEILQSKCVNCHSNENPRAGLDLEGEGSTLIERANDVYQKLVGVSPNNSVAKAKGYKYIQKGRIDKSFLFKKINNGLDKSMALEEGEESPMPLSGDLTDVEKEIIRQWILWGAPQEGEVVSEAMLKEYYNGKGEASFPNEIPAAPDPSEGFQVKMGPFFMLPGGEKELYLKYQLDNETQIEVNRIEVKMSNYSHHFIIYDYGTPATQVPEGMRFNQDHTDDVNFVVSVAEPRDVRLPNKTAFFWDKNHVLDLNSHYINYAADKVYQSEVYVNIYTQPNGSAAQQMHSNLLPNFNIRIPNNGEVVTHSSKLVIPKQLEFFIPQQVYAWTIGAHTHKYGVGYKIWTMDDNQEKEDFIYDGSCPGGIPGCPAPFFDYQHIPLRAWEDFLPLNLGNGLFHEAKYINDGPEPVQWGPTSNDEMMLFGLFYVTDTTGLNLNLTTATKEIDPIFEGVKVFPNPMQQQATILLPADLGNVDMSLYDMLGKEVRQQTNNGNAYIRLEKGLLAKGMYIFTLTDEQGRTYSDKILIE